MRRMKSPRSGRPSGPAHSGRSPDSRSSDSRSSDSRTPNTRPPHARSAESRPAESRGADARPPRSAEGRPSEGRKGEFRQGDSRTGRTGGEGARASFGQGLKAGGGKSGGTKAGGGPKGAFAARAATREKVVGGSDARGATRSAQEWRRDNARTGERRPRGAEAEVDLRPSARDAAARKAGTGEAGAREQGNREPGARRPEGRSAGAPRSDAPRAGARETLRAPVAAQPAPEADAVDAPAGPRGAAAPKGSLWLYGQHAVAAALVNPARRLRRLVVTEEGEANLAARVPRPWSVEPERTERARMDQMLGRDVVHQGIALLADPLNPPQLADVLDRPGPLLVLDQVTDPRNIGAILRSAAAFGAAAVITQDRHAPEETGAMARAASGAMETVPLIRAVNLSRTLVALKAAGCWVVGLDAGGTTLDGGTLTERRVALVLGAEEAGLRRLTRETCDEIAGLAMPGGMESLNVSVAASVALYELVRPVPKG